MSEVPAGEELIPTLEEALNTVAQALPGLGLTTFQEKYISMVLVYEQVQLSEGWVAEWITDMAGASAGLPEDDQGSP
jgi:DNA mismatch repair protein MutH